MHLFEILMAFTFLFGPIRLLTTLRIFNYGLDTPMNLIFGYDEWESYRSLQVLLAWLDNIITYLSLFFQCGWWVMYCLN